MFPDSGHVTSFVCCVSPFSFRRLMNRFCSDWVLVFVVVTDSQSVSGKYSHLLAQCLVILDASLSSCPYYSVSVIRQVLWHWVACSSTQCIGFHFWLSPMIPNIFLLFHVYFLQWYSFLLPGILFFHLWFCLFCILHILQRIQSIKEHFHPVLTFTEKLYQVCVVRLLPGTLFCFSSFLCHCSLLAMPTVLSALI